MIFYCVNFILGMFKSVEEFQIIKDFTHTDYYKIIKKSCIFLS